MSPWTEECVRLLDELSEPKRRTAQQIADQLSEAFGCNISKSAVVSKMRGLGINDRLVGRSPDALREQARKARSVRNSGSAKKSAPARTNGHSVKECPKTARAGTRAREAVDALNHSDCRWPEGDPLGDDFRFCEQMRSIGSPYCEHHLSRSSRRPSEEYDA